MCNMTMTPIHFVLLETWKVFLKAMFIRDCLITNMHIANVWLFFFNKVENLFAMWVILKFSCDKPPLFHKYAASNSQWSTKKSILASFCIQNNFSSEHFAWNSFLCKGPTTKISHQCPKIVAWWLWPGGHNTKTKHLRFLWGLRSIKLVHSQQKNKIK